MDVTEQLLVSSDSEDNPIDSESIHGVIKSMSKTPEIYVEELAQTKAAQEGEVKEDSPSKGANDDWKLVKPEVFTFLGGNTDTNTAAIEQKQQQ